MYRICGIILSLILLISATGCTSTQKGMGYGALGGAVVGGTLGYATDDGGYEGGIATVGGVILGALTGAVVGGVIGSFSEK